MATAVCAGIITAAAMPTAIIGRLADAILPAVFPTVFPAVLAPIFLPGRLTRLPGHALDRGHCSQHDREGERQTMMFHEPVSKVSVWHHNDRARPFIPEPPLKPASYGQPPRGR